MAEAKPHQSYLEYVQDLVGRFPRLQLLADFMSPTVRIAEYHKNHHVTRRMKNVDVTIIDFGPTPLERERHWFNNITSLTNRLNSKPQPGSLRTILVENISADVIEVLGKKYSLDPRFFENHLQGIQKLLANGWTGDKTERLESATSEVLSREFFVIRFSRPYCFEGWDAVHTLRGEVNVPRFGNRARNLYLHEYVSIYGPIKRSEDHSTCIVICDPLLDDRLPDEIYLRNNERLPLYNEKSDLVPSPSHRKQTSTRSVLEKTLLESETQIWSDVRNSLLQNILSIALDFHAAALWELALGRHRLTSNYLHRPEHTYLAMFNALNRSGGWLDLYDFVQLSIVDIKNICKNRLPPGESQQSLELEIESAEAVQAQVKICQTRLLDFLWQEQEISRDRNLERLTKIAFLFLPFSTVATILSIQGTERFAAFVTLALPTFLLCIVVGIRGASVADTLGAIRDGGRRLWTNFSICINTVLRMNRRKESSDNPDVEKPGPEPQNESVVLYQKIIAMKAKHDEQSMSILITEAQNLPSLRRRTLTTSS